MSLVLSTHGSPEVPPDGVRSPPVRRAVELHHVWTGPATGPRRDRAVVARADPAPAPEEFPRTVLDERRHQRLLTGTAISGIGLVDVLLGLQVAAALSVVGLVVWVCPLLRRVRR